MSLVVLWVGTMTPPGSEQLPVQFDRTWAPLLKSRQVTAPRGFPLASAARTVAPLSALTALAA